MTEEQKKDSKRQIVPVGFGAGGVKLENLQQCNAFAAAVVQSGLAPKGDTAAKVLVKLVAGAEIGLPPMRALSSITVVNGRVGLMGQAVLAKARESGAFEYVNVGNEGEGDERCGYVRARRKGETGQSEYRFTVADAKRAGLWAKPGPWSQYPDNMLRWRAVGHWGDLYAGDVLLGLTPAEIIHEHAGANGRTATAEILEPAERPTTPDPLLADADVTDATVEEIPPQSLEDLLRESVEAGEAPSEEA